MFSQEDPGDTSGADWTGYNESQLSHALQLDGIDDATRAAIIQAVFDTSMLLACLALGGAVLAAF